MLNQSVRFSLVSSVSDMWQSGAYGLSILIALFSGIWPYVKRILLGITWRVPMRPPARSSLLQFLDQMGKFSFIDLFVSRYMIVSFYVSITKQFDGYGLNIKVVVEPDVGLNTFVIGTVASMLYSHCFLYLDANCNRTEAAKPESKSSGSCYPFFLRHAAVSIFCALVR